ncbi:NAD(P)H:quinone oxidoreductase [Patulibacter minatonensis]|uniref:NAD(P)H:quinone oxidoreductase n=1 Tax=Patulibacter minatonensis TaxID=298163 RepID=UPI00047D2088|nr:NAD(P)H:quinone oxidoreductase [Patulibacter minatonensis]
MSTKILVAYYSSTGNVHQLAAAVAAGAESTGAEVRLRRAPELAPDEAVAANPAWKAHLEAVSDVPDVTPDDFVWSEGYALGTPTRYGLPAAQLKQVIDGLGPQWQNGDLANKAATSFVSASNAHGGNESTLIALNNVYSHWGAIIVPSGYTSANPYTAGGNPYGTGYASGGATDTPLPDEYVEAAKAQGARLAQVTRLIQPLREKP